MTDSTKYAVHPMFLGEDAAPLESGFAYTDLDGNVLAEDFQPSGNRPAGAVLGDDKPGGAVLAFKRDGVADGG